MDPEKRIKKVKLIKEKSIEIRKKKIKEIKIIEEKHINAKTIKAYNLKKQKLCFKKFKMDQTTENLQLVIKFKVSNMESINFYL